MYLHIGNDYVVNTNEIVGIFDIENSSISKDTKDFFVKAEKNKRVVYCTYDFPKSFIVCIDKDFTEKVYVSQLACSTLLKRYDKLCKLCK